MSQRDRYLLDRYGIDEVGFEAILAAQSGGCGICGRKRKKGESNLSVDHCHRTGRLRGILCRRCNERLLTAALDKPDILRSAAAYLEGPGYGFVPEGRKKTTSTRYRNAPTWMKPKGKETSL